MGNVFHTTGSRACMFSVLTDQDLGKIIAYLRSVPPKTGPAREARVGPLARLMFVMGKFEPVADRVHHAAQLTREFPPPRSPSRVAFSNDEG